MESWTSFQSGCYDYHYGYTTIKKLKILCCVLLGGGKVEIRKWDEKEMAQGRLATDDPLANIPDGFLDKVALTLG